MQSQFGKLFDRQANEYAKFRPTYPEELFDYLAVQAPDLQRAWDCGTGNGQAAVALARHFEAVSATDISAAQIEHAQPHPRVTYGVCPSESSDFPPQHFDLVTVANAVHWFNMPGFFKEASRVLKPKGLIAVWCYGNFQAVPELEEILQPFYDELKQYWATPILLVRDQYRTIEFPFAELDAPQFYIKEQWTWDRCLGFLSSWSAVQSLKEASGKDPIAQLRMAPQALADDLNRTYDITFSLHMRIGRV